MTPEEKARISRKNGAKSRGPVTDAGKDRVSRNALKHGEYSEKFKHFLPPHDAVNCNEDRDEYNKMVDTFIAIYQPVNQIALDAVGDIAVARWQIRRYELCITTTWNLTLAAATSRPNTFAPELAEIKLLVDATKELFSGNSIIVKLNREIARLQQVIMRAERRIKTIHATFPDAPVQTQPKPEPPVENNPLNEEIPAELKKMPPPIYTRPCSQAVIEAYQRRYPGRPIVILPSEVDDDGPDQASAPPKAA